MAQSISPNQEDLHLLAEAINLEYPSNPKQINKAVLVLSYLLGKGIGPVLNFIDSIPQREFYIDAFAKEIYLLRFSKTIDVYTKSEPIEVPIIARESMVTRDKQGNEVSLKSPAIQDELTTEEVEYSLGSDPKRDIIEYKVRKELLALIKANPGGIDKLEQMYDARGEYGDSRSPFSWVNSIKVGYFNVLLGGRDRSSVDATKKIINNLDRAQANISTIPADISKDSISKG